MYLKCCLILRFSRKKMSSDNVRRNYEVASLHAKLQAKTYENEMLKRLVRHLVSVSPVEDVGSQQVYSDAFPPPTSTTKSAKVTTLAQHQSTGRAVTWRRQKRFCKQFVESSPCLPIKQDSSSKTVELSENSKRNLLSKEQPSLVDLLYYLTSEPD